MTTSRSKLRLLHGGLIAVMVASAFVIIKVEYFDARPVASSTARPGDVVIVVKQHPLYVTALQARERRTAIAALFIGAFAGVAVSLHLKADRGGRLWQKKDGYSS
jgi:hypothetical protein